MLGKVFKKINNMKFKKIKDEKDLPKVFLYWFIYKQQTTSNRWLIDRVSLSRLMLQYKLILFGPSSLLVKTTLVLFKHTITPS